MDKRVSLSTLTDLFKILKACEYVPFVKCGLDRWPSWKTLSIAITQVYHVTWWYMEWRDRADKIYRYWLARTAFKPLGCSLRFTAEIHYHHGASDTNEVLALSAYLLKPQYFIISHLRFVPLSGSQCWLERSGEEGPEENNKWDLFNISDVEICNDENVVYGRGSQPFFSKTPHCIQQYSKVSSHS